MRRTATSRRSRIVAGFAAAALLLVACGGQDEPAAPAPAPEEEEEEVAEPDPLIKIRFSTNQNPGSDVQDGMQWFIERLMEESGGSLEIEMFSGTALLKNEESIIGVADGRADMGFATLIYHNPGEIPLGGLWFVPGIGNANAAARQLATYDLATGDNAFAEAWAANGVTVVGVTPIAPLGLGSKTPITTLADFKGKNVRSSGAIAKAYAAVGATPVAIGAIEIYESLQRGIIDAFGGLPLSVAAAFGLHEVAPHLLEMKELQGIGNGTIIINTELYESMTQNQRDAIARTWEAYKEYSIELLVEREIAACQTFLDAGGSVTRLSDAERQQWLETVGTSLLDAWVEAVVAEGIAEADARAFVDEFAALTEKYGASSEYIDGFVSCFEQQG